MYAFTSWSQPKASPEHDPQPCGLNAAATCKFSQHDLAQGNVWQQLWQTTQGQAAREQEPLMNAEKEAERVFHDLEQVPPAALWDQLLALAAVAAAAMLAACPGAALPPARQQLLQ